jgi:hypothetical protein
MSFLEFLGNVEAAPKEKAPATKKERNPVKAEIRVFKTGAVYPSAAAVEKFNLEYPAHDAAPGNGFDVIDGRVWANLKSANPALFISPVSREKGKIDLFGMCTYNDGVPATSVMTQGSKTFGIELLQMIKEVYGIEPTEDKDYVDMLIIEDNDLQEVLDAQTKGIYYLPKTISRGEKAGQPTYVRRDNATIYGFAPIALFENSNPANIEDTATPEVDNSVDFEEAA